MAFCCICLSSVISCTAVVAQAAGTSIAITFQPVVSCWPAARAATPTVRIPAALIADLPNRSEEHTSELQSLMRISYAVFCLKKKTQKYKIQYQLQNSLC